MRACATKTPRVTPSLSPSLQAEIIGTPNRLSSLRQDCLIRDRHRCIITRHFDRTEANLRTAIHEDARDDDGDLLTQPWAHLEAAHIIPHSLVALDKQATKLVTGIRIHHRVMKLTYHRLIFNSIRCAYSICLILASYN